MMARVNWQCQLENDLPDTGPWEAASTGLDKVNSRVLSQARHSLRLAVSHDLPKIIEYSWQHRKGDKQHD